MRHQESNEQISLFVWVEYNSIKYPELGLLFHIPNGGKRNKLEAIRLKREGVKAGVPDLFLPVSRKGYNGMFIELKAGKNKPTELQKKWRKQLIDQGYYSIVCYGWAEAAGELQQYLG